jgi:hypothetical protein
MRIGIDPDTAFDAAKCDGMPPREGRFELRSRGDRGPGAFVPPPREVWIRLLGEEMRRRRERLATTTSDAVRADLERWLAWAEERLCSMKSG